MVIKVLISGITASKEVRKRQQRALLILDSLQVDYKVVDVSEAGNETDNRSLRLVCKKREGQAIASPPQFFKVAEEEGDDDEYLGDYEDFDAASDDDTALTFLQLQPLAAQTDPTSVNGQSSTVKGEDEVPVEGGMNGHGDVHSDIEHSDVEASHDADVVVESDNPDAELQELAGDSEEEEEEDVVIEAATDGQVAVKVPADDGAKESEEDDEIAEDEAEE